MTPMLASRKPRFSACSANALFQCLHHQCFVSVQCLLSALASLISRFSAQSANVLFQCLRHQFPDSVLAVPLPNSLLAVQDSCTCSSCGSFQCMQHQSNISDELRHFNITYHCLTWPWRAKTILCSSICNNNAAFQSSQHTCLVQGRSFLLGVFSTIPKPKSKWFSTPLRLPNSVFPHQILV